MSRKDLLFLSSLLVLIILLTAAGPAAARDSVYSRNGEVYVMIGSGINKGVYASQTIEVNTGTRQIVQGGEKLFGAKDEYYSIATDQFRNIYVLSAFADPAPTAPPPDSYYPIDPPAGEGVVGIGADDNGDAFYDVINYCEGRMYTLHGAFNMGFFQRLANKPFYYDGPGGDFTGGDPDKSHIGRADKPPQNILNNYITNYSGATITGSLANPPAAAVQPVVISFPNGSVRKDNIPANINVSGWVSHWGTYSVTDMVTNTTLDANQIRRIGKQKREVKDNDGNVIRTIWGESGCWYPGHFVRWYYHGALQNVTGFGTSNGGLNLQGAGNWQRRYEFKKQYIKLWVTQWVADLPAGLDAPPPGINLPRTRRENDLEVAFDTTNISYKADFGSACGEDHADTQLGVSTIISTDPRLSLSTTGAGRRYTYASMPTPTAKLGKIEFIKDNTGTIAYGVPVGGSTGYTGAMGGTLPMTEKTLAVGAATQNPTTDWVYASPVEEDNMDVIDYCIADQWDGKGGIAYRLLKSRTGPAKKLKWNKYDGYNMIAGDATGVKVGSMVMADDVKCIAADGRGSVYYLTDARPQIDATSTPLGTFDPIDQVTPVNAPVATVEDGMPVWRWVKMYNVRAATELYRCDYYTKTVTKQNDFTVGFEKIKVLEVFKDAAGNMLKYRGTPQVIGPKVSDIKLDLATINLAGPPAGSKEKNVVNINSVNATQVNVSGGVKINDRRADGVVRELRIDEKRVDQISEDTLYEAKMENAPPQFTDDLVKINKLSGEELRDLNNDGVIGGFLYSIRPGTATYYWKVEMVEPMKKVITGSIAFPAPNDPNNKVNGVPPGWPPPTPGPAASGVNWTEWRKSSPPAGAGGPEADPKFQFTPTEPGIYKISLMASVKRYKYEDMPYPSYITDRDSPLYKPATPEFLFFDDGSGGGTAEDGIRNGSEDYISERYLLVTAKAQQSNGYISNIKITGDSNVDENTVHIWTASAKVKFVKSYYHENVARKMETYNGIGVWDYPTDAVRDWGLPAAFDNVGEDYVKGAPGAPANFYFAPIVAPINDPASEHVATGTLEAMMRNFGQVPPGGVVIDPAPPNVNPGNGAKVWGTGTSPKKVAVWVEGAGTQADPTKDLNKADRGCITYEWRLAAENVNGGANPKFPGMKAGTREPDIVIAKGRLSDELPFPGDGSVNAVEWGGYQNNDRVFDVKVRLRYAFDMPLEPGRYFLYIKFYYPMVKWEGRQPKTENNVVKYAYYDLVDGGADTTLPSDYQGTINNTNGEPRGFEIVVNDRQSPQAYFNGDANNANPADPLDSVIPPGGTVFKGGTTGDRFPTRINFNVCDNNPNRAITGVSLKALLGSNTASLADRDLSVNQDDNRDVDFTEAKVRTVLEKTIHPPIWAKAPGMVQDATTEALVMRNSSYPGYGVDAPYRLAKYHLPENTIKGKDEGDGKAIPYDYCGDLPMYAGGQDGAGNHIGNASCSYPPGNNDTEEIGSKMGRTDTTGNAQRREYRDAPAHIIVVDNDSPTLVFRALRARDGVTREYTVQNTGLSGADNKVIKAYSSEDNDAYHEDLSWDTGKLKVIGAHGFGKAYVREFDINGGSEIKILDGISDPHKDFDKNLIGDDDIGVGLVDGEPGYIIKFNGRNVGMFKAYDDYKPNGLTYYNFDLLLNGTGGDTLELIEDARTRFEVAIRDNLDGNIGPTRYVFPDPIPPNATIGDKKFFFDTIHLASEDTLREVLGGWHDESGNQVTYGIFRNPTPANNPKPFIFILVRDNSNNATAAKIPSEILHTFMKRDIINVESRRAE